MLGSAGSSCPRRRVHRGRGRSAPRLAAQVAAAGSLALLAATARAFALAPAAGWRPHRPCPVLRTARAALPALSDPKVQEFLERHVVDEEAMISEKPFPIPRERLIELAKIFLATESAEAGEPGNGTMLTEDFRFIGPVIGPLSKEEFLLTVPVIDWFRVFPDGVSQFHHFRVDPFEPNRVWFTARGTGTHTGKGEPGTGTDMLFGEPTGQRYVNAPQAGSIRFTEEGLVDQLTIGYVMDRYIGNTGGLGGIFGPLHAIGKGLPFEECQPWRPSWGYQLYVRVNAFFFRLQQQLKGERVWDGIIMPKGTDEPL